MLTPEQREKLRSAGYSPAQISAYELRKFSSTTPGQVQVRSESSTPDTTNRLKETGQDFLQTGEDIRSSIVNRGKSVAEIQASEANPIRKGFQIGGQFAGALGDTLGSIFTGAGRAALSENQEQAISRGAQRVAEPVVQSEPVQELFDRYERLKTENPVLARDIEAALNLGELALDAVGGGVAGRATNTVRRVGGRVADTATDVGRATQRGVNRAVDATGNATSDVAGFATSQITGLDPDTILTVIRDVDTFEDARRAGFNRMNLASDVEQRLNQRLESLSELGDQYDVIRQSGDVVELPSSFMDRQLKELGFVVKDGKVRANTKSPTRDTTDLNALQRLYDNWSGQSTLEADEFLNLRHDLSKLSKFGREVGSSDELEAVARNLRENLNEFRDQVDGLTALDEQFAPERQALGRLRKELFDAEGNLKDSAVNRIANATGKGKDPLLNRLKELKPDIEERINVLKAIENVEYSKGQAVGSYARSVILGGLGGGAIFSGNIPMGIALLTLSSPETFIRAASFYGRRIVPTQKRVFDSIQNKLRSGERLNKAESRAFSDFINMDKNTLERVLQGVGAGATAGATE